MAAAPFQHFGVQNVNSSLKVGGRLALFLDSETQIYFVFDDPYTL